MKKRKTVDVFSRKLQKVVRVKRSRAEAIAKEGDPEYKVNCPKCHCLFGVN